MNDQPPIKNDRLTRIYLRSMLLTMLGSIVLFSVSDQSLSFSVIGIAGSFIGYWYAAQGPSSISRLAINALLAIVIVLGLINALKGNFSVSSFAFFSLLLMILKLFDLRTPRDYGQILVLSLALIIAAALTSSSMPAGIGVFVMGFVFIRALMLFRLYALTTNPIQQTPYLSKASTDLRSMQTITGFVCTIVALLIFLAMPRSFGNNALGQWGGTTEILTTGFADDVQLGRPGRLTDSPTPVLRMTVTDRNDQPFGSDTAKAIYLRGSVLTQYNNGRWVAHHEQNVPTTFRTRIVRQNQSIPIVSDISRANWTHEYAITFDRPDQNYGYLFTPWKPLELKTVGTQSRVGIDQDTRMILLANQAVNSYRIRTTNPEIQPLQFPTQSPRPPVSQAGVTPPISDLANQILTRAGIDPDPTTRSRQSDAQAVRALENHLRTQFKYTLVSEPVPPNRDATEWFLFDRREGHCEYYASSLTLLTRSVGIPARVITGYVATEYNDVNGSFVVRESNAHAWVEAMVAQNFWRTFDGTPQSDFHEIHEPDPTFFTTIAKFYDAIEHAWITAIVGYDSDSRDAVFGDLDPDLGLNSFAVNLQNRIATGRAQLLRQALIVAGSIFIITMSTGLILIFFIRHPVIETIKARITLFLTLNPNRRSQTQVQLAATQLTNLIHAHLKAIDSPCPKGIPLRTHLNELQAQDKDPSDIPLDQAASLLYNHHFQRPSPESTQSRFIEQAQSLINRFKSLR